MRAKPSVDPQAVVREFDAISLGDTRLDSRARAIVEALAASPGESFPRQEATIAGREALYRFLANPKVSMDKLLAGHVQGTVERVRGRSHVRVLHDSSAFKFSGDREGLGSLLGNHKGFIGHFTLAVSADETREPLGVLAVSASVRSTSRELSAAERMKLSRARSRAEKKSSRWERQALAAEDLIPTGTRAVHVMDQEADDFIVYGELRAVGLDFVVRGDPKRLTADGVRVDELLETKPSNVFRSVRLSPREKTRSEALSKTRLPRVERDAHLEIRWGVVSLPRRPALDYRLDEVSLNAVHVTEPSPPPGEQAIEWMLFTSETVTNLEEATAVVDHYRARWIIEEYFKALKTGCAFERRQLTSFEGLTRALALFTPIAWHMLTLRHLARVAPSKPASTIFDSEQLLLLAAMLKRHRYVLPDSPTSRDAMLGIAALGGHIKNNGDPGWQVLGRGYVRFAQAEEGWRLARTSDQS